MTILNNKLKNNSTKYKCLVKWLNSKLKTPKLQKRHHQKTDFLLNKCKCCIAILKIYFSVCAVFIKKKNVKKKKIT